MSQLRLELTEWTDSGFLLNVYSAIGEIALRPQHSANPFGEIVDRTAMLLRGIDEVSFIMIDFPDAYEWTLRRVVAEAAMDDTIDIEIAKGSGYSGVESVSIFRERCSVLRWVRQVKGVVSRIRQSADDEAYFRQTHHRFPSANLTTLNDFLESRRG